MDGKNWEATKELYKIKMIHVCLEVRPELDLQGEWLWVGTQDLWMCSQLNEYLKAPENFDLEELKYAACWLENSARDKGTKICKLQSKKEDIGGEEGTNKKWDPLDYLPPPIPSTIPPVAPPVPPLAPPVTGLTPSPAVIPLLPPPFPMTTSLPPPNSTVPPLPPSNPVFSPSPTAIPLPPPNWDSSKSSPLPQLPCNSTYTVPLLSDTPTDLQQGLTSQMNNSGSDDGPYCNTPSRICRT